MIVRYFKKIKNRIEKLEWLIERVSIDTEYDEDADAGIIGGSITFKDGSIFHFKEVPNAPWASLIGSWRNKIDR